MGITRPDPPRDDAPTASTSSAREARADDAPQHSLAQGVADALRDMIIQDELAPGERIRERTLCTRLGVSRTPMREALKTLAAEGLVQINRNRGAIVSAPDPKEVQDLLQVLGALEGLAGELAASRASDAQINEVTALHHEMLAAFARGDRLHYFKANQAIHSEIVAASGNAALMHTHRLLNARLYRVRFKSNARNTQWHKAVAEHEQILDALKARDAARLRKTMRSHLGSTWSNIEPLIGHAE